jgi:TrmH family RNA methyltransferase
VNNEISSAGNAKIKLYGKLSEKKKYRDETGLFVLEGERLVADAIDNGIVPEEIFVLEKFFNAFNTPVTHIITEAIAKKITSAKSAQGIFAICKKPVYKQPQKPPGDMLILAGLADPGNIGTILRTADALGVKDIVSIESADIYAPKTVRAAMGSLFRLNILETDAESAKSILKNADITVYAAVVDDSAPAVGTFVFEKPAAVMIGNEANGIPANMLTLASHTCTIKMRGNANSLNAAAAAGILIWELRRGT